MSPADLYNDSTRGTLLGTIICGTSTELIINGDYKFIGIRSSSGALYLNEIKISYLTLEDDPDSNKPTSITATCNKQFNVGDIMAKKKNTKEVTNKKNNEKKSLSIKLIGFLL